MELVNRIRGAVVRGDVSDRSIRHGDRQINGSNADSVTLNSTKPRCRNVQEEH